MDLELAGNAVLCTAATSGLGRASAERFAREGADVAVCGTTPDHVAETREALEDIGDGDVLAVEADITDPDEIEALVQETVDRFGGLDHVVTSAGGPAPGPFMETTERQWYTAYDLLVMSVVWTTRAAYPHLEASDAGTVVNITSSSVREVIDDLVLSNAVRRAVIGLMKTQAREFAPEVRVNAVLPGTHETPRIEEIVESGVERGEYDSYEEGLEAWSDAPLGRVGQPEELGDVVAYLSSARSSYVTGTALAVDGGMMRS
ncbi:SDR family oxidoreductase [Haloarcula laminariae]|uniref:SDR family oxidoreductase n=1 Tax=Haloarcula laminariae TaxID=2961577 RepID=UPI0024051DC8|nr:SDR family oxidoreductase [Halomicroarcula sp. FL173]